MRVGRSIFGVIIVSSLVFAGFAGGCGNSSSSEGGDDCGEIEAKVRGECVRKCETVAECPEGNTCVETIEDYKICSESGGDPSDTGVPSDPDATVSDTGEPDDTAHDSSAEDTEDPESDTMASDSGDTASDTGSDSDTADGDGGGAGGCTANGDCSADEYCNRPDGDCGSFNGVCNLEPTGCPRVYDPVCGCDGQTYSNDCEAASDGVNVDYKGKC